MKKGKYSMSECKKLLNKGLQSLTDDEKRNVINSLAIHLGVTTDSVKNWIGGGLARRDVDKPIIYKNLKKSDWYLLRDIFDIIFDGKKFEEERVFKTPQGKGIDDIMKEIEEKTPKERNKYFKYLFKTNRVLYNEISLQYNLYKKYGGNKPKSDIRRHSNINKQKILEEKEATMLNNLQNGGKVRGFGRIL